MKIKSDGVTFDDVLVEPRYSEVLPSDVILATQVTRNIRLSNPLISAPMDTVTESHMATTMQKHGCLGIIHRNMSVEEQISHFRKCESKLFAPVAVGTGKEHKQRMKTLRDAGVTFVSIDSAHGHSKNVGDMVKYAKDLGLEVIAGNVATAEGAQFLTDCGADAIKVGIGPGSICTTRIVSGVGVPQISAIMNAYQATAPAGVPIIADGGLRNSGDIVKALVAGASSVMIGSMFAGTFESPGEVMKINGKEYKSYRGMGSLSAMKKGSADRYGGNGSNKVTPEGVEGLVPYKGTVVDVIEKLIGGIRSGMGYCGARNIVDLHRYGVFTKVSKATVVESHPHDIIMDLTVYG